jgi:hypothetical protein
MIAIDRFLEELCPLNEKSVFERKISFPDIFFSLLTDIHLILVHNDCFAMPKYRSSLSLALIH